jgi:hypothetical protein
LVPLKAADPAQSEFRNGVTPHCSALKLTHKSKSYFAASPKGLSVIDFGPFDLFSWQFLWVGGLMFGKCLQSGQPVRVPVIGKAACLLLAIGFLAWRWCCVYLNVDLSRVGWLLDKWHLGPLRVLNFFVLAWLGSKLLPSLARWETVLHPFALVGQHMLPVFAFQSCLSLLLVGWLTPLNDPAEVASTSLVVAQILLSLAFAWLLDWRRTPAEQHSRDRALA